METEAQIKASAKEITTLAIEGFNWRQMAAVFSLDTLAKMSHECILANNIDGYMFLWKFVKKEDNGRFLDNLKMYQDGVKE